MRPARCRHGATNIKQATIVDRDGERWLRTVCPDCMTVVETKPQIIHRRVWPATDGWVEATFQIIELP
jgi:uncharacterized C2H2 Zn-finger protein